ncbi:M14 family metallopeptidase [Ferrovibrio sp. MS7]|uniref:M14 family metallopeptidase n=1 Tax=Ferrovibrio plantarum TaxID=3119164 RepID=UPI00313564F2
MTVSDYFSATYAEAREKFRAAARDAGATLTAYENPKARTPDGAPLTTDVACLGPANAKRVYLTISGTHGAEGFCGSGCQVGFFHERIYEAAPADTKIVMIHAINPYGFAWIRRVTEDNVDLNRNFQDFAKPLPNNAAYKDVHDWLIPADWDGPAKAAADKAILDYQQKHGLRAYQAAVTGGQYSHGDGLFFGGGQATWSNTTLRRILAEHVPAGALKLASIDYHTGLGPMGYGEPIYVGPEMLGTMRGVDKAKAWYGPSVTDPNDGSSTSAKVTGTVPEAFLDLPAGIEVVSVALEYGTKPVPEVLNALRADHWLHARGDLNSALGQQLKRQMRDAFYVDTAPWKAAIFGRAADFALRSFHGLAE